MKNVYFLPMSRGLDQYLANRLTGGGFLQVVTDPSKADALFTDHLDAAFEASVKELYPETKPVVAPAKSADKPKEAKPPVAEATPDASEMKMSGGERPPTVARSRGTVFLVKRGTGNILWSVYHDPSIRRPKELDQAAGKIVAALKKAMAAASPAKSGGK